MLKAWSRARGVVTAIPRVKNFRAERMYGRHLGILAEPFDRSPDTPGSGGRLEFARYRQARITNSL